MEQNQGMVYAMKSGQQRISTVYTFTYQYFNFTLLMILTSIICKGKKNNSHKSLMSKEQF